MEQVEEGGIKGKGKFHATIERGGVGGGGVKCRQRWSEWRGGG